MKKILAIAASAIAICAASTSCTSLQNINMERAMTAASKATQAMTLSNDQIVGYAAQAVAQMDKENKVAAANSAYAQRLNRLTNGLTSAGNVPLNFKVYMTKEVNAFACADGSVRVYSGIMDMMDDDELLGIIGHEIGHVAMEHSKNAFKQELMNSALLDALASTSSSVAALTDTQLSQLGTAYLSARFSRKQENQADDFGYEFLKGAGRNPYGMVEAFEKMLVLESQNGGGNGNYLQSMFSSHPETKERIKHITQRCVQDGYKR